MSQIIAKKKISEQVDIYLQAVEEIRAAYAKLEEVQEKLNLVFPGNYYSTVPGHYDVTKTAEDILTEMKQRAWRDFVNQLGIPKILSIKKYNELQKQLDDPHNLPEITHETVLETLLQLSGQANDFVKDACTEVFNYLRPQSERYKTNNRWQVGKKVILVGALENSFGGGFRVSYWRQQYISAIDNVFHILDGKGTPGGYRGPLVDAIQTSETGAGETDYFYFKCYRNCNLHLEFKRPDLVKMLNQIGGDGSLPGAVKNQ